VELNRDGRDAPPRLAFQKLAYSRLLAHLFAHGPAKVRNHADCWTAPSHFADFRSLPLLVIRIESVHDGGKTATNTGRGLNESGIVIAAALIRGEVHKPVFRLSRYRSAHGSGCFKGSERRLLAPAVDLKRERLAVRTPTRRGQVFSRDVTNPGVGRLQDRFYRAVVTFGIPDTRAQVYICECNLLNGVPVVSTYANADVKRGMYLKPRGTAANCRSSFSPAVHR
jgi:hypothetical protein